MTIAEFDQMEVAKKSETLYSCCPSEAWVKSMLGVFPVEDLIDLLECAEEKWYECNAAEWLEVFHDHHKVDVLSNSAQPFISAEPGLPDFSKLQFDELVKGCHEYEETFGYNFIIFVDDKTPAQILQILNERLHNDSNEELVIASAEQNRIIQARLKKLFI
jgi:2-oxo-4-hydroxy-4-carboxy--5-ureidoimidazoline (OHCU) decarboxylase